MLNLSTRKKLRGLVHVPAALPPERNPIPTEQKVGWDRQPVWKNLTEATSLVPARVEWVDL
jgi:hypothetical protein